MSTEHPIIAVTGSSGAGTSSARLAFEHIFRRLETKAAFVEGDSFHAFDREQMSAAINRATIRGETFSHFGETANQLDRLEALFRDYGASGRGQIRHYIHTKDEAQTLGQPIGTFTPWEELDGDAEILLYEGLHGGFVSERCDIARHADLLVGMVPTVNLEWIQKIHRDTAERGYAAADVTRTILRRMHDYVTCITPQFSRTHINFQRVPLVDTSNPFIARDVPTDDESMVVIRFSTPLKFQVDFQYLLAMLHQSFMSRPNTIVIPGGKLRLAMEVILTPLIRGLVERRPYGVYPQGDPRADGVR